ncbi:hypothetical protein [Aequorivita vitellina]|uniref:hypothetical protein n=1 Tax=Aequorivita vitellina TaxID=2874475 RepID=UPI001F3948DE|nr:hypothetical protein [Aequorivita vitellina]
MIIFIEIEFIFHINFIRKILQIKLLGEITAAKIWNKKPLCAISILRIIIQDRVKLQTKEAAALKKYVVLQAQFYGKENNTL